LQDFFFEVVLVGIVGFLGIVYLCFVGIGTGIHFLHFPLEPVLNYFWGENDLHPFFIFHRSTWCYATMFLIGQLVVSVTCFLSLGLILFYGYIGFLLKCVCAISVPGLGVI
jgi:hypothetical protein